MRLGQRIDALREAPNAGKPALLTALSETPCEAEKACELKRTCLDGYTRHVEALSSSERARSLLAATDGGLAAAIEAAQALNRAELELERAKTLTDQCASLQGALLRLARQR